MITKFKEDRDPQGLNVSILDCEKEDSSKIWENILAIPFLAEKRMVVLENLLISKQIELQEKLLARVEENNIHDSIILIFWEGTDKFKTKLGKTFFEKLKKEKYAQSFEPLAENQISSWIIDEVKEREGKITSRASSYLSQNIGQDMWQINSTIDQLINYKNFQEINIEDIKLFISEKVDDNIFNLVDNIVEKRPKKVFTMIQEQYRIGKDPLYIFAMLLRQFKIMIQLKDLEERSINPNSIAKDIGLHPFVIKKSIPLVRKYKMDDLKKIYKELLELDTKIKTGQGDQRVLIDIFVGKLSLA